MPPDADKIRQRINASSTFKGQDLVDPATVNVRPTKALKGTEVAIEGKIYDLNSFEHPGGGSIYIFGGNDVTVTYKMIHPYHTSKHLEKMKQVGTLSDYKPEYKFDTEFEREIKTEVFKIVRRGREFGTWGFFFRVFFYVSLFFTMQYLWVANGSSWKMAFILGISQAFIGLNVQHDANHGAASRRPWVNDLLGYGADLIGGSKWTWMEQHWTHHSYTNHFHKDPDAMSAEPMILFTDYPLNHPARKFYHKLQAFFFFPVLSFYWLSSVFNPQILDLRQRGAQSVGIVMENDFIVKRRKFAILLRLIYISLNIVAPMLYAYKHNLSMWATLGHIWLLGTAESLALSVLFSLSHNFENADRDPTKTLKSNKELVCWFKSQVEKFYYFSISIYKFTKYSRKNLVNVD